MLSKWVERRLGEMIDVNPAVKLSKGEIYPFIDIDKIEKQNKFVSNIENRLFDGQGGSRFQTGDTVFSRITPCLENRKIAQVKIVNGDTGFGSTEFFVFRHKNRHNHLHLIEIVLCHQIPYIISLFFIDNIAHCL